MVLPGRSRSILAGERERIAPRSLIGGSALQIAACGDNDLSDRIIAPRGFFAQLTPAIAGRAEVQMTARPNPIEGSDQSIQPFAITENLNCFAIVHHLKAEHGTLRLRMINGHKNYDQFSDCVFRCSNCFRVTHRPS
jgi:hypothetical protein